MRLHRHRRRPRAKSHQRLQSRRSYRRSHTRVERVKLRRRDVRRVLRGERGPHSQSPRAHDRRASRHRRSRCHHHRAWAVQQAWNANAWFAEDWRGSVASCLWRQHGDGDFRDSVCGFVWVQSHLYLQPAQFRCTPPSYDTNSSPLNMINTPIVRQILRRRSNFRLQRLRLQQEDQRSHKRQPQPRLRLHRRRRLDENLHRKPVLQRR